MRSGFLLDTNILSEEIKLRPEPQVVKWLSAQREEALFLSVITLGELHRGIALLPEGKRRTQFERWFAGDLLSRFAARLLPVTQDIVGLWAVLSANRQLAGSPLGMADGLIAATALKHELTLVTRNTKDFSGLGLETLNPWHEPA